MGSMIEIVAWVMAIGMAVGAIGGWFTLIFCFIYGNWWRIRRPKLPWLRVRPQRRIPA